jgi:ribonuclease Z
MRTKFSLFIGFGIGMLFTLILFTFLAFTPQESSPVKALSEREVYYPGTEDLAADEMRVVALGTGMPNARPKQAAACFLVELGNGDKFLFDAGTGSAERLSAMKIPYDYIDKIFLGHLHSDHIGDLDAIWIGGVVANRVAPLKVWGPSGAGEKYGTNYMVEHLRKTYTWDVDGRVGNTDTRGLFIEVTEFDYKQVNQIIYQKNDVIIKSFPAIHALDGSVSYTLEWKGLKFAYSSDTYPNKWWIEHTKNSDFAIHECFASPKILIEKQKFPPQTALNVGTQVHTSPAQFGKVMAEIQPRMAVAYHFFNDYDTQPIVLKDIRDTYDGPLSLAVDYMVWNVTKEKINTRMAAIDEDIWPQPSVLGSKPADPSKRIGFSKYIWEARVNFSEVLKKIYDDVNKEYGTDIQPPQ